MRYSKLFGRTKLEAPHDSDSINAKYLTQAGFADKLTAGVYYFLPLGLRVLEKVKNIIREEMNAVEGQEILMPSLHPLELWETTGRNKTADAILYRTKGAGDKDFVFGPSHEEAVTPLAAKFVKSYKDLPFSVYQIQTKFRNEPRAKSGLLRGREFGMKDMYSFHTSDADLDLYYERVKEAYMNVYRRCGLTAYVVEAGGGIFSDKLSHEFSVETVAGEDKIMVCKKCNVAQNLEVAEGKIHNPHADEKELPMKEVKVEREFNIEASAKAHDVPETKVLKTIIYKVGGGFVGVCIRGDLQVNEYKLGKFLGAEIRTASPKELEELGLVQGFISPVGMQNVTGGPKHKPGEVAGAEGLSFIGDNSIKEVKNFVTGANKKNVDLINVNVGRDFVIETFADFLTVEKGFKCSKCDLPLEEIKAVEAGNIFKLGTKYSKNFDLYFTNEKGERNLVVMGCYGIGTTRMVGTIVEASHDEKGIIWPKSVAPFLVHMMHLGEDEAVKSEAEKIYKELLKAGVEVLYDDRNDSAGKKFNDADLIGIPLRITISNRTLKEGSVEWKLRNEKDGKLVKLDKVLGEIKDFVNS
ncbi:MAG: proline--tRNA ligase [Candidatus Gracilibacteria bacterium]|jgi:prolyl-tRNA synthetase